MKADLNIIAQENEIIYTITLGEKIVENRRILVNGLTKDDLRSLDNKMRKKTTMINKMLSWGYTSDCILIIYNDKLSVGQ